MTNKIENIQSTRNYVFSKWKCNVCVYLCYEMDMETVLDAPGGAWIENKGQSELIVVVVKDVDAHINS